ncbi:MAG TPA: HEAT repeat domain-containing protein [Phycisphaeraceae bacterium]
MGTKRPILARRSMPALGVAACLLGLTACRSNAPQTHWLGELLEPIMPPTPAQAARDAFNVYDADLRRRSIALLAASPFGGEEPYVRTYRLLIDDPDATVRAACAQALSLHGGPQDAQLIIPLLRDSTAFVRWEAAKALQRIHNPEAVTPLIQALRTDEDADVRMAAAHALGQYAAPAVVQALIAALNDDHFGVAQASLASLRTLTGQALGPDGRQWLAWADQHAGEWFAHQRPYTYQPYYKPPGLLDKMQFWRDHEPPAPRPPIGLDAEAVTKAAPSASHSG